MNGMTNPYRSVSPLKKELFVELEQFLKQASSGHKPEELIKIDLHCHDFNSDVPDELIGRILNVPETWTRTKTLFDNLKKNNVNAYTITNHNDTRSCYQMLDKGYDILTGAEFSCMVPDYKTGIHVLAYGFNRFQEEEMLKLRSNVYEFQKFARNENIPTIWAHPLYHYKSGTKLPPIDFFEKLSLIFERFEVLNGQRDNWQNLLVKSWVETLSPEKLDLFAEKYKTDYNEYCRLGYKKAMTGGSDSHFGLFAGQTGSYLFVSDLETRLKTEKVSELTLEALRSGNIFPYGVHNDSTKLVIALLGYVCQIALYREDPGLMRVVLHKGTYKDKLLALLASNGFAELNHHKTTMKIIGLINKSFMGKKPKKYESWLIPQDYKKVFNEAVKISQLSASNSSDTVEYSNVVYNMYYHLNKLLFKRLSIKLEKLNDNADLKHHDINSILNKTELPSDIRKYLPQKDKEQKSNKTDKNSDFDISEFLDGLSFPFLSAGLLLAANFTGVKALYNNRKLLNYFSGSIEKFRHQKRMLWIFEESGNNEDMLFIKLIHAVVKANNYPVDFLVCSEHIMPDDNLIVIKPVMISDNPVISTHKFRIPVFLEAQKLFEEREYDRIVCSSEGIMGLLALYLKSAFSVPAGFLIMEDYSAYARNNLNIDEPNLKRLNRGLRLFYNAFDKLIVTNNDAKQWAVSRKLSIPESKLVIIKEESDANSSNVMQNICPEIFESLN